MTHVRVELFKWDETFTVSPPVANFVVEEKEGWRDEVEARLKDFSPRHEYFTTLAFIKDSKVK
jgi:hypothetical protein